MPYPDAKLRWRASRLNLGVLMMIAMSLARSDAAFLTLGIPVGSGLFGSCSKLGHSLEHFPTLFWEKKAACANAASRTPAPSYYGRQHLYKGASALIIERLRVWLDAPLRVPPFFPSGTYFFTELSKAKIVSAGAQSTRPPTDLVGIADPYLLLRLVWSHI